WWIRAPRCAAPTPSSSAASARWKRWPRPTAPHWRSCRWKRRMATGTGPRRASAANRPRGRHREAGDGAIQQLPRVLPLLPVRAREPHVAAAALHRQLRGAGAARAGAGPAQSMVAAGGAGLRLRLRLGGALLLREEPPGDVPASVLFAGRRLGDVRRHPARPRPAVARITP